jgi:hypothetical protein
MNPQVQVTFPSGTTRTIFPLRMLVQTQNAEFKAQHGFFLPGVAKQHPTVKALRDEFEIPARTWAEAAEQMRALYTDLKAAINGQPSNIERIES